MVRGDSHLAEASNRNAMRTIAPKIADADIGAIRFEGCGTGGKFMPIWYLKEPYKRNRRRC